MISADHNGPKNMLTQEGRSRATDVATMMTLHPKSGSRGSFSSVVSQTVAASLHAPLPSC